MVGLCFFWGGGHCGKECTWTETSCVGQCNRLANATHVNLILCVSGYGVKAAANNTARSLLDHRRGKVELVS